MFDTNGGNMTSTKAEAQAKMKAEADAILAKITARLATIDGIAITDAFELGLLVREYGDLRCGAVLHDFVGTLFEGLFKRKPGGDEPWKGGVEPE